MTRRGVAWGVIAAAGYLVVAWVSFGRGLLPTRPFYDGQAPPQPYRWVSPPPDFAPENIPPEPAAATLEPSGGRYPATTLATADGQAIVSTVEGAFEAPGDAGAVRIDVTPVDPTSVAPPLEGLRFDGNGYEVVAALEGSGEEVELAQPVTVVLRYPVHATDILVWTGTRWRRLESTVVPTSLQIYATSDTLGVFVAAAREGTEPLPQTSRFPTVLVVAGAAAVLSAILGVVAGLRARNSRARRVARASGKPSSSPNRAPKKRKPRP
jgi:hypothetical protein